LKPCPKCHKEFPEDASFCSSCGYSFNDTLDKAKTTIFPQGTLISNRYKVERELGKGGMGVVFLAQDTKLDIPVAIKILPKILSSSERAMKSLLREAKLSMSLSHPNILRIHNLEEEKDEHFIVMEYVEGKTLEKMIEEKERFTLEEFLPIAEKIAAGLDFAHSKNILHLDIKPPNILIDNAGSVKIADFGIAYQIKDNISRISGKETSGTLCYMSPEQMMGERVSRKSDIYSFGALAYEALSGNPPFHKGHIPEQIRFKSPDPLGNVPEHVNGAILQSLDKIPENRPESASEMVRMMKGKEGEIQLAVPETKPLHPDIPKDKINLGNLMRLRTKQDGDSALSWKNKKKHWKMYIRRDQENE